MWNSLKTEKKVRKKCLLMEGLHCMSFFFLFSEGRCGITVNNRHHWNLEGKLILRGGLAAQDEPFQQQKP